MAARHHIALKTAVLYRNLALFLKKQSKKWFWILGAPIIVWRGFLAAPRASTNQASLCLAESRTVAEHDGCGNMAAHNAGG